MRGAYSVLMPLAPWEPTWVVAASLASIRQQSLPAVAVVISCDGAPPDALAEVIRRCDLPVELVEGPGQEGAGPVLARGLKACPTELVVRADADDLNLPGRCEKLVTYMLDHPNLAALGSVITEFTQNDAQAPLMIKKVRLVPLGPGQVGSYSRWRNPLNHPSVILQRSKIEAVGSYRSRSGFEDYDLWLRLLASGQTIDNLADRLVLARVGPAHQARRRGLSYLLLELRFLAQCWREGLLESWVVLVWLVLRCPLRLLPSQAYGTFTNHCLRQQGLTEEKNEG